MLSVVCSKMLKKKLKTGTSFFLSFFCTCIVHLVLLLFPVHLTTTLFHPSQPLHHHAFSFTTPLKPPPFSPLPSHFLLLIFLLFSCFWHQHIEIIIITSDIEILSTSTSLCTILEQCATLHPVTVSI